MTAPQFRDQQAQRVYGRLLQIGEGAAAFFADAYRLIEEDHPFETQSHLIGHVLRELESSVRHVLAGVTEAPIGKREDGKNVEVRETITHVIDELGMDEEGAVAAGWLRLSGTLHRFAHRSNLDPPRDPREIEETWLTMVVVLDGLLDRFEARYADIYRRLDRLIGIEQPTRDAVRELKQTIPQTPATLNYFFSRLTNPRWLPCLQDWSVLRNAPTPIVDEDANTIQFPMWAAAQYLKRITSDFPGRIAELLQNLETQNVRAQAQAIEIALLLPVELTLAVVPQIQAWAGTILRFQLPCEAMFELVIRLARDGHVSTAIELLDQILAVSEETPEEAGSMWARHEDVPYELETKAEDVFDALVAADAAATVELLAEHVERRLLGDPATGIGADGGEPGISDYSTTWLPSLRSKAPWYRGSMRSFLAPQLRRVLDGALDQGADAAAIVDKLRTRQTMLFRRIELDFLAGVAEKAPDYVIERLMDRDVFKADALRAEYADLFTSGFPLLSEPDKQTLLGWIDEGLEHWEQADDEQSKTWRMIWRRDWLALVEPHLGDRHQQILRDLIDTYGPPKPFSRSETMAHFAEPESPLGQDDVDHMRVDDVVAVLRDWEPDGTPDSTSRTGLSRTLSRAVADDPNRFAAAANSFSELHPAYVDALLTGLCEALRKGQRFEWGPVLDYAEQLLEGPLASQTTEEVEHHDLSIWNAVKRSVLDLLKLGLRPDGEGIPADRGEQVWTLIVSLTDDEDPSPRREDEWVDRDLDATSLALNSVRPRAIATAIQFVFWRNSVTESKGSIRFGDLPEVAALLERHVNPTLEPSLAVRSVVGQELGRLIQFDCEWVAANRGLLFPESPDAQSLRRATFDAFLRYGDLHPSVLPALTDEYEAAIHRCTTSGEPYAPQDPERKLAEHLMILYWWGELGLETGLIPLFFSNAPPDLRREALHFIGWSVNRLKGTDNALGVSVRERLENLWDWRASSLERSLAGGDAPRARAELMEYGWWFASGAFDVAWSLPRLRGVLALCGNTAWDRQVAEYLAHLVDKYPAEVIETLGMVDPKGNGEPGYALHWRDHARRIFCATVEHPDPTVRQEAIELINRWIAQGHLELQDLVPPNN